MTERTLTPVLTRRWASPKSWTLETYTRLEGYTALRTALAADPDQLIQLIKDSKTVLDTQVQQSSNIKSFSNDLKLLSEQLKNSDPDIRKPINIAFDAAGRLWLTQSLEYPFPAPPGARTRDSVKTLDQWQPNGRAGRVSTFEVIHCLRRVHSAVNEAYAAGYLGKNILDSGFDLDIVVHAGAGAYEAGEETALLNSLEGRRAEPRLKPPFPAVSGLYAAPTVVNNVETICSVPYIVNGGSDWFRTMGSEKSPGPKIYSISGHVQRPGQYEAPLGITLRELLDMAGGMKGGPLKFWTPGGSSTPLLTAEHMDVPLDFEGAAEAGSMLGTTAVMVFNQSVSVPWAVMKWTEFYEHESCGKCTPCREGTYWLTQILQRMVRREGTPSDVDNMLDICDNILGRSFCALGDGAVSPITSGIKYFRQEFLDLCAEQPGYARRAQPTTLTGSVR